MALKILLALLLAGSAHATNTPPAITADSAGKVDGVNVINIPADEALDDATVTSAKLADGAVTTEKTDFKGILEVWESDGDAIAASMEGNPVGGYLNLYSVGGLTTLFSGQLNVDSYINNGGDFGVGTGSPAALFHVDKGVEGGEGGVVFIKNSTASAVGNKAVLAFGTDSGATSANNPRIEAVNVNAGNGASELVFYTHPGGGTIAEVMRMKDGGNVAVGTDTAHGKFHVEGAGGTALLALNANTFNYWSFFGGNPDLTLKSASGATNRQTWWNSGNSASGFSGGVSIGTGYLTSGGPVNGLRVEGVVGIGTQSPATSLDVSGRGRFTGTDAPVSGSGMEIAYSGGVAEVLGYNRDATEYLPTSVDGSVLRLNTNSGGNVAISTTTSTDKLRVLGRINAIDSNTSGSGSVVIGTNTMNNGSSSLFFNGSDSVKNWRIRQNDIYPGDLTIRASDSAGGGISGTWGLPAIQIWPTNEIFVGQTAVANGVINSNSGIYWNMDANNTASNDLFVWGRDRTNTTGGTELMRLTHAGFLGLGAAPNVKLKLEDSAATDQVIGVGRTGIQGYYWGFDATDNKFKFSEASDFSANVHYTIDTNGDFDMANSLSVSSGITAGTGGVAPQTIFTGRLEGTGDFLIRESATDVISFGGGNDVLTLQLSSNYVGIATSTYFSHPLAIAGVGGGAQMIAMLQPADNANRRNWSIGTGCSADGDWCLRSSNSAGANPTAAQRFSIDRDGFAALGTTPSNGFRLTTNGSIQTVNGDITIAQNSATASLNIDAAPPASSTQISFKQSGTINAVIGRNNTDGLLYLSGSNSQSNGIQIESDGDVRVNNNILFTTSGGISANTTNGSDTGLITLQGGGGGGAGGQDRGAFFRAYGKDNVTVAGEAHIYGDAVELKAGTNNEKTWVRVNSNGDVAIGDQLQEGFISTFTANGSVTFGKQATLSAYNAATAGNYIFIDPDGNSNGLQINQPNGAEGILITNGAGYFNTNFLARTDDVQNLGSLTQRFNSIYAGSGGFFGSGANITGITSSGLVDGAVTTSKLNLGNECAVGEGLQSDGDGTVSCVTFGAGLADGEVTTAKIANGAVTSDKIGDGEVTTNKIVDGGVTAVKIVNGAVGSDQLATDAVTAAKIANGAVTTDKTSFTGTLAMSGHTGGIRYTQTASGGTTAGSAGIRIQVQSGLNDNESEHGYFVRRHKGFGAPGLVTSGNQLGEYSFEGYEGPGWFKGVELAAYTAGGWNSSGRPVRLDFNMGRAGSKNRQTVFSIDSRNVYSKGSVQVSPNLDSGICDGGFGGCITATDYIDSEAYVEADAVEGFRLDGNIALDSVSTGLFVGRNYADVTFNNTNHVSISSTVPTLKFVDTDHNSVILRADDTALDFRNVSLNNSHHKFNLGGGDSYVQAQGGGFGVGITAPKGQFAVQSQVAGLTISSTYTYVAASGGTVDLSTVLDSNHGILNVVRDDGNCAFQVYLRGSVQTVTELSDPLNCNEVTDTGSTTAVYWTGTNYNLKNNTGGNRFYSLFITGM
jgi:hypothetical protein